MQDKKIKKYFLRQSSIIVKRRLLIERHSVCVYELRLERWDRNKGAP